MTVVIVVGYVKTDVVKNPRILKQFALLYAQLVHLSCVVEYLSCNPHNVMRMRDIVIVTPRHRQH